MTDDLTEHLRRSAADLGFDHVRMCGVPQPAPGIDRFRRFLLDGRHAGMAWLERGLAPREDPALLVPRVRSAMVLGMSYGWPAPPDPGGLTGRVSCYAWGRDYHNLIGKRLRRLSKRLRSDGVGNFWSVDARPVIERAWAERAGLGTLGRNCCTLVPGRGSYLFLAGMLLDAPLLHDEPLPDWEVHCGRCRRCLDACPTGAFIDSGVLDSRRCVSYWTIEHRGEIPIPMRAGIGRWVFGCDDCQEACPHNHDPQATEVDFQPRPGAAWLDLDQLLRQDDDAIDRRFTGSPLRRARPAGLKRNACVVLGNLGDRAGRFSLQRALLHTDSSVQEAARWALDRL